MLEGTLEDATPVRARDIPALAPMLARAFEVDAAYRYLMPDPSTRLAGLTAFFAGNLRTHLPHACTRVSLDEHGPSATVTLRPPGGVPISTLTMIRHGLLPFAFAHGPSAVKRLLWLKDTYDALEAEAAGGRPHWYVHMMAVRPDRQGRGLGSRLLERMLRETADARTPAQTVLTTHLRENIVFYERAGFELTDERTLEPPGGAPYTVWSMKRRART
ncbi:MAG TPA: GNAT family N-acetyltransferase [Polyangiaceae bacterium]|nr:GNAT family N-acetyltransferase [Polyangiaceae bacterium]